MRFQRRLARTFAVVAAGIACSQTAGAPRANSARAAIERKESRGGHFRDDYPDKNPQFGTFNITLKKAADGSMQLERVAIPPMPAELKAVIEEMK